MKYESSVVLCLRWSCAFAYYGVRGVSAKRQFSLDANKDAGWSALDYFVLLRMRMGVR